MIAPKNEGRTVSKGGSAIDLTALDMANSLATEGQAGTSPAWRRLETAIIDVLIWTVSLGSKLDLEAAYLKLRQVSLAIVGGDGKADPATSSIRERTLGWLSFAELMIARAMASRSDDKVATAAASKKYVPMLKALAKKDMMTKDLARAVSESDESVSRKITELRKLGLVDFVSKGRERHNFLTPSAREHLGVPMHKKRIVRRVDDGEARALVAAPDMIDIELTDVVRVALQECAEESPFPLAPDWQREETEETRVAA